MVHRRTSASVKRYVDQLTAAVVRAAAQQQRHAVPPLPASAPFATASVITSQRGSLIFALAAATDSGRGILPHSGLCDSTKSSSVKLAHPLILEPAADQGGQYLAQQRCGKEMLQMTNVTCHHIDTEVRTAHRFQMICMRRCQMSGLETTALQSINLSSTVLAFLLNTTASKGYF